LTTKSYYFNHVDSKQNLSTNFNSKKLIDIHSKTNSLLLYIITETYDKKINMIELDLKEILANVDKKIIEFMTSSLQIKFSNFN